jgi:hypothetical protein
VKTPAFAAKLCAFEACGGQGARLSLRAFAPEPSGGT